MGSFAISIYNGLKGVSYARNTICDDFLKTDYDALWFFDYDCQPWKDSVEPTELLQVDADIVGGVYPLLQLDPVKQTMRFHYIVGDEKGHPMELPPEGVAEVHYVGMGCTLIKRHVLQDRQMLLDPFANPVCLFREEYWPTGKLKMTEDFDFCDRAKKLGYSVKCHSGVKFGHVNSVDLQIFHSLMPQMSMKMLESA
jgi:hypothetical protein